MRAMLSAHMARCFTILPARARGARRAKYRCARLNNAMPRARKKVVAVYALIFDGRASVRRQPRHAMSRKTKSTRRVGRLSVVGALRRTPGTRAK